MLWVVGNMSTAAAIPNAQAFADSVCVPPLTLLDRRIVNARDPAPHQPCIVELPQFNPIRPAPLSRIVMPFVLEANRHPVSEKSPQRLPESVIQLLRPLPPQKRTDLVPSLQELRAI